MSLIVLYKCEFLWLWYFVSITISLCHVLFAVLFLENTNVFSSIKLYLLQELSSLLELKTSVKQKLKRI